MHIGPVLFIAVGAIAVFAVQLTSKQSASKRFTKATDRHVIEAKLGATHACRALIAAEIFVVLAGALFLASGVLRDTDFGFAVFAFAFFAILAGRAAVRRIKIAAEAELEYRRLHRERV